jgi:hypothetical protein
MVMGIPSTRKTDVHSTVPRNWLPATSWNRRISRHFTLRSAGRVTRNGHGTYRLAHPMPFFEQQRCKRGPPQTLLAPSMRRVRRQRLADSCVVRIPIVAGFQTHMDMRFSDGSGTSPDSRYSLVNLCTIVCL